MGERNTENFLRFLNEQNDRIAAEKATEKVENIGSDPIRLQREAERREKYGTLRARSHTGSRPKRVTNVFGHTDLT